jgi:Kef-type K+ transport system membrane component KefB
MEDAAVNLLVIVGAIVLAPIIASFIPRIKVPVVVIEIALGIIIGPQVLGLAQNDELVQGLSQLGLAFLFFLAGFEIDLGKIRGAPLKLAGFGWLLSIVLSVSISTVLFLSGLILLVRFVAIGMTTTALGTLMPILRDADEVDTPLGRNIMAAGAVGEFGPIVLTALLLSTENNQLVTLALLIAFGTLVIAGIRLARRWHPARLARLAKQSMNTSGQLPVRLSVLVLIALISVAVVLHLEFLLGAFAAGVIVAQAIKDVEREEIEPLRVKYEGISFGLFVPVFFVVSGMNFDLHALFASPVSLIELPMFLLFFLVVRGLPALLFYRRSLDRRERTSLAFLSATELPLVVAITTLGLQQQDMKPQTAAAMVGAAMLSVFLFPLIALSMRRRNPQSAEQQEPPALVEEVLQAPEAGPLEPAMSAPVDASSTPARAVGRD